MACQLKCIQMKPGPKVCEFGFRPPASPSCRLYEPEAIGACTCAPVGMGNAE